MRQSVETRCYKGKTQYEIKKNSVKRRVSLYNKV